MTKQANSVVSYDVLAQALQNAALSRRAVLQIELSVALIHFTQETGGTDTYGKANLKALYNAAGYDCMSKQDRDYKTVNRRLNASAKLFDKLGSSLVNGWVQDKGDTDSVIQYVVTELETYQFHTVDDVLDFVGVESNRTRKPRQPVAPVKVTKAETETETETEAETETVETVSLDIDQVKAQLLAAFGNEMLREFCASILVAVADRESAQSQELKAA